MTPSEILNRYKKVAIVGLSPNPDRPSHEICEYLISHGFDVVGVNPGHDSILGRPCYRSLLEVPGPIEIVDVFRSPEHVPMVAHEAVARGAKVLWLQLGVGNRDAERIARAGGVEVVTERCILVEHRRGEP